MGCNQQRQMFPSIHGTTPHSYAEQCPLGHHNFPKNEPSSSSFFHLSPSLYHNNQFLAYNHELLSRQFTPFPHPPAAGNYAITSAATDGVWYAAASTKGSAKEMMISSTAQTSSADKTSSKCPSAAGRKRGSNRERHSKIITAQGLRDRRMRLSVDVAHEFFGLQDMLGFDKASKTVGWLMRKSKAAIKELTRNIAKAEGGSESSRGAFAHSTSESEDMSGIDETAAVDEDQQEDDLKQKSLAVGTPKGKRIQESPKATHSPIARESRAIARSKARERTREKMTERLEKSKQLPQVSTQDPTQLSPLSPLGSTEESGSHSAHDIKSLELGVEINEPNRLELSMFDYDQQYSANSQGMSTSNLVSLICSDMMNFFPENWDMAIASARSSCCDISNTHLFTGMIQEGITKAYSLKCSQVVYSVEVILV